MACGLYIHVPFCRTRCHYCAFYLRIYREDLAQAFVSALLKEMHLHAAAQTSRGLSWGSVYFGGGTPTMLPARELIRLLDAVRSHFPVASDAEITVEGAPDSLTAEDLCALRTAGFNRLSLGMETSVPDELLAIGRRGLSDPVVDSVQAARRAGFDNINLDLIYGLPGQTENSWRRSLDEALALAPSHLSIYALSVEAGSRFHVDAHRGDLPELNEALTLRMEGFTAEHLTEAGFERYEISNYARPGFSCRHNRLYWEAGEYLGLGPSAQSYVGGRRFGIVADLDQYIERLGMDTLPLCDEQQLPPEQQAREALVFGLRLLAGVDTQSPAATTAMPSLHPALAQLQSDRLLEFVGTRIRLTELGRRFADTVAVELLT